MKKLLLILFFLPLMAMAQKMPNGVTYDAKILKVTDGDTVVIEAPFLPAPLKPQLSVRIFGVDTPEKGHRAQCASEDQRGQAATKFTEIIDSDDFVEIVAFDWHRICDNCQFWPFFPAMP